VRSDLSEIGTAIANSAASIENVFTATEFPCVDITSEVFIEQVRIDLARNYSFAGE
jgi:hypothetical protein